MSWECLTLTFDGPVAVLTISRPKVLNAINDQVLTELLAVTKELAVNADVRALVLTGEGTKVFVAGADIAAMAEMDADQAFEFSRKGQAVFDAIEALPFPVIAAVNGFALGGGSELVLACDIVYASENAIFGQPEVKLGVVPGFGGTARLVRVIGRNNALEWILMGDNVSAADAYRVGLVQKVVPQEELMQVAMAAAHRLAGLGPLAVRTARSLVKKAQELPLEQALEAEATAFAGLFKGHDQKEGMQAFLQRRKPEFKGN